MCYTFCITCTIKTSSVFVTSGSQPVCLQNSLNQILSKVMNICVHSFPQWNKIMNCNCMDKMLISEMPTAPILQEDFRFGLLSSDITIPCQIFRFSLSHTPRKSINILFNCLTHHIVDELPCAMYSISLHFADMVTASQSLLINQFVIMGILVISQSNAAKEFSVVSVKTELN